MISLIVALLRYALGDLPHPEVQDHRHAMPPKFENFASWLVYEVKTISKRSKPVLLPWIDADQPEGGGVTLALEIRVEQLVEHGTRRRHGREQSGR